ncbi:MAG: hypothetical protein JO301_16225, partial [Chitinophagaceae bacterium]|nr:hypothetical protein [Chitinophagaceae bacterium]
MRRRFVKHAWLVLGVLFSFIYTAQAQKLGDNLGNHTAKDDLKMQNFRILNAKGIVIGSSVFANDTSVALEINSINKALLISRINDTLAIKQPVDGMIIYLTTDRTFRFRQNNTWAKLGDVSGGTGGTAGVITLNGIAGDMKMSGDNQTITVTAVTGTGNKEWVVKAQSDSSLWNANKLMGQLVSGTVPTTGQVLQWDGAKWTPANSLNFVLNNGAETDSIVTTVNGALRKIAANKIRFDVGNGSTSDSVVTIQNGILRKVPANSLNLNVVNGQRTDSLVTVFNGQLRKIPSTDIIYVSDTASMMAKYLRVSDTASMLSGYYRKDNLGDITPTSVNAAGAITGTTLAGTLVTGAQPNITS